MESIIPSGEPLRALGATIRIATRPRGLKSHMRICGPYMHLQKETRHALTPLFVPQCLPLPTPCPSRLQPMGTASDGPRSAGSSRRTRTVGHPLSLSRTSIVAVVLCPQLCTERQYGGSYTQSRTAGRMSVGRPKTQYTCESARQYVGDGRGRAGLSKFQMFLPCMYLARERRSRDRLRGGTTYM